MMAYQNCNVDDVVQQMTGSDDDGYGVHIRSGTRPIVTLLFATQEEAERARGEIARAVEKAIEVTPHG
jgi:hypothetical protein